MDAAALGTIVGAAVLAGVSIYLVYRRRRWSKQLLVTELVNGYFQGDLVPADQLARRIRQVARCFISDGELYAIVTAAFQNAVDTRLAGHPPSKEAERKLLGFLAVLKKELGLADLYRIEAWRAGRE